MNFALSPSAERAKKGPLGLTHKFASDLYDIFRADSPSVAEQYVVCHNPTQRSILSLGGDFGA